MQGTRTYLCSCLSNVLVSGKVAALRSVPVDLFKFVWSYPLGAKTVFADLNSAAAKNGPTSVPADYVLFNLRCLLLASDSRN